MRRVNLNQQATFYDDSNALELRVPHLLEHEDGTVSLSGISYTREGKISTRAFISLEINGEPDLDKIREIVNRGNGIESVK